MDGISAQHGHYCWANCPHFHVAILITFIIIIMPRPHRRGGIKQCFCLTSVWRLSRTSGLTPEQRGHQAALVGLTGRSTWTYSNGDLSICVHDVYRVTTCRPGWWHIVVAARPPTACYFHRQQQEQNTYVVCPIASYITIIIIIIIEDF